MRLLVRPPASMSGAEIELDELKFPDGWFSSELWRPRQPPKPGKRRPKENRAQIPLAVIQGIKWCYENGHESQTHSNFDRSVWISTVIDDILFDCNGPTIAVHFINFHSKEGQEDEYLLMPFPQDALTSAVDLLSYFLEADDEELKTYMAKLRSMLLNIYALKVVPYLKAANALPMTYITYVLESQRRQVVREALQTAMSIAETVSLQSEGNLDYELEEWVDRMANDEEEDLLEELLSQCTDSETPSTSSICGGSSSTPQAGASSDAAEYSSPTRSPTTRSKAKTHQANMHQIRTSSYKNNFDLNRNQLCSVDSRAIILSPPPVLSRGVFKKDRYLKAVLSDKEKSIVVSLNNLRELEQEIEHEVTTSYLGTVSWFPENFQHTPFKTHNGGRTCYSTQILAKLAAQQKMEGEQTARTTSTSPMGKTLSSQPQLQSRLRNEYTLDDFDPHYHVARNAAKLILSISGEQQSLSSVKKDIERQNRFAARLEGRSAVSMMLPLEHQPPPVRTGKGKKAAGAVTSKKQKGKRGRGEVMVARDQISSGSGARGTQSSAAPIKAGVLSSKKPSSSYGNNSVSRGQAGTSRGNSHQAPSYYTRSARTASASSETAESDDVEDQDPEWAIRVRGRGAPSSDLHTALPPQRYAMQSGSSRRPLSRSSSSVNLQTDPSDPDIAGGFLLNGEKEDYEEDSDAEGEEIDNDEPQRYLDDDLDSVMPATSPYDRENWEDSASDSDSEDEMEEEEVARSLIPVPASCSLFHEVHEYERDEELPANKEEMVTSTEDSPAEHLASSEWEEADFLTGMFAGILGADAPLVLATKRVLKQGGSNRSSVADDGDQSRGDETDIDVMSELEAMASGADDSGSFEVEPVIPRIPAPPVTRTYGTRRKADDNTLIKSHLDNMSSSSLGKRKSNDSAIDTHCSIQDENDENHLLGINGFLKNICSPPTSPPRAIHRDTSVSPPMPRSPPHSPHKKQRRE